MSTRKTGVIENFGERLAQLRKGAGHTQVEFAAEVGIMQRNHAVAGHFHRAGEVEAARALRGNGVSRKPIEEQ